MKNQLAKNQTYWTKRAEALETRETLDALELVKETSLNYDKAAASIEKDLKAWYQRFADNNQISLADAKKLLTKNELKEFKWTVEDYIKAGQENALDGRWMKELENASAKRHISRLEAIQTQLRQEAELVSSKAEKTLTKGLKNTYQNSYYRQMFDVQQGFGIGFDVDSFDDKALSKIIQKPWTFDKKTFSDRIWEDKEKLINNLNTNLTQQIIRGEAPDNAIKALSNELGKSKKIAGRLIMTETAAIQNEAQMDCFDDLGVEEYEIVATLDSHTSELCQTLDGKVFKTSDKKTGVTAPPFHPNCRTATAPYFDDEFSADDMRAARGEDGKEYLVPASMKYEDWKSSFVDGPRGAITGAITDRKRQKKHAEKYYEGIRNRNDDVSKIANNTGFSEKEIRDIKDYVFFKVHDFGERFVADYHMAVAWQRLSGNGKDILPSDILLLKHERLERQLVLRYNKTQEEAHTLTARKYNYAEALRKDGLI